MIDDPRGNSPILSRNGVVSPPNRPRIAASASGWSTRSTPSAFAAHCRVWSSGVAPMPPNENTTSGPPKVRASVAVMRSGLSPRYSAQSSRRPRAARMSIIFGKCLSSRLPRRISSPMMIAPKHISGLQWCYRHRLLLHARAPQLAEAVEAIVDEREAGDHRDEEPDQRNVRDQRQDDSQQVQLLAVAPEELADLFPARVLRHRVVPEDALVEIRKQEYREDRPEQRDEPQRQREQAQHDENRERRERVPHAAGEAAAVPALE